MALMKHVAVCSPDISKLIYQISCKLGAIGFSKMIEQKYGISPNCEDGEYTELKLYLEVFKKLQKVEVTDENIELSNIIKDLQIINNCEIKEASLTTIIERVKDILQSCSDCNNYSPSVSYTTLDSWYETQQYIECLQNEFENNGYIDYLNPIVDLCNNLHIDIDANKLCQELIVTLNANKIACSLVSNINATNICNLIQMDSMLNIDITANTLCDLVLKDIKGELPICDMDIDINTNEVNGCSYTPTCVDEVTCVTPLIIITDNTCDCIDNAVVEIQGSINIITDCEDEMIYSVDGTTWTNIVPIYEDIDNVLYYKCTCENSIHLVFKNEVVCPSNEIILELLCNQDQTANGDYYSITYKVTGDINNLIIGNAIITPPGSTVYLNTYQYEDFAGFLIIDYSSLGTLPTQIEIPVVCGNPIIITDIFEKISFPPDRYVNATTAYDCDTNIATIVAGAGYEISIDLINWSNNISFIKDVSISNPSVYFYIRSITTPDCVYTLGFTPACCETYGCAGIYIDNNNIFKPIIEHGNCEYIMDFYVDGVKIHTEGYGSIYNSAIENPYNLDLGHIVLSYCGTYGNPVYIYPVVREFKCGGLLCRPNCELPPLRRNCINACALPLDSGIRYTYETGVSTPTQNINYYIDGDTTLRIFYNMYVVSDSIEVWYNGYLINGAYNLTSNGFYDVPITVVPGVTLYTIKFIPNQLLPTKATISVGCLNNSPCVTNLNCLSLNTLDFINPIITTTEYICYNILTVTLPILVQGNYGYNDCNGNNYNSSQSNTIGFQINTNTICDVDRVNSIYLCNASNFQNGSIIVTDNPNVRKLFISDTSIYLEIKNYINGYSCIPTNPYNNIVIDLVNTESTACNKDCIDDINCNIYTTYPIVIYPCYQNISYNDVINTITITNNTLPEITGNYCDCDYNQKQSLFNNSQYSIITTPYKTIDRLSYFTVNEVMSNNIHGYSTTNTTSNNIHISGCTVEELVYYTYYHCENNPTNSVRIYKKDTSPSNMYALTYQGNITWTDGRVVDINNYIYTFSQISVNTGNC